MDVSNIVSNISLIVFGTVVGVATCYTFIKLQGYKSTTKRYNSASRRRANSRHGPINASGENTHLDRRDSIRRRTRRETAVLQDENETRTTQTADSARGLTTQLILPEISAESIDSQQEPDDLSASTQELNQNLNDLINVLSLEAFEFESQNDIQAQEDNEDEEFGSATFANSSEDRLIEGVGLESNTTTEMMLDGLTDALSSFSNNETDEIQDNWIENNVMPEFVNIQDESAFDNRSSIGNSQRGSFLLQKGESTDNKSNALSSKMLELLYLLYDNKDKRTHTVHRGITCDECNTYPVTGVRYKCAQCPDFDLCEFCESKNVHKEHVFLKIKIPAPSMLKDHTPILNKFYPGNMLGAYVPTTEVARMFSDVLSLRPKFTKSEIFILYDEYCSLADFNDGVHGITKANFSACIGIYGSQNLTLVDVLFSFYDKNGDDLITFDEMVYGMGIILRGSTKEKAREIFRAYDLNQDGFVSLEELRKVATSSFLSNQKVVQDMVSFINNSIVLSPSEILPDQPISSAFTSNIPADSHSVLDKQVESLRNEVSILKRSAISRINQPDSEIINFTESDATAGLSAIDLPGLGLAPAGTSSNGSPRSPRPLSGFSDAVETADRSRSKLKVSKDNARIENDSGTITKASGKNRVSETSRKNADVSDTLNTDDKHTINISSNTKNGIVADPPRAHGLEQAQDSFETKEPIQPVLLVNGDNEQYHSKPKPEFESDSDEHPGSKIETHNDAKTRDLVHEDDFILSKQSKEGYATTFEGDLSNVDRIWKDPTSSDDWPVMDLLLKDAVTSVTNDVFKQVKNRSSSIGLTCNEFIELSVKDPRPIQWIEVLNGVF